MSVTFKDYSNNPSVKVRNILVNLNRNLARKEAHAIAAFCNEAYEDLEQEAMIGLIKAVEKFNPDKGVAFSSYAVPYIHGKLLQYLRDRGHLIRLSQSTQTLINRSKKAVRDLSQELGRTPTSKEVADKLGVTSDKYEQIKTANRAVTSNIALDNEDTNEDNIYFAAPTPTPTPETPLIEIDWSNLSQGEIATLRKKKGNRRKVWGYLAKSVTESHATTKATTHS